MLHAVFCLRYSRFCMMRSAFCVSPHSRELPACRVDIIPARAADVGDDAMLAQDRQESLEALRRWAGVGGAADAQADRVPGDEVDVGAEAVHELGEQLGL